MLKIDYGDSKALKGLQSHLCFFRTLWKWLEKKDRNTGQGWTSLGPSWLWVEVQPPGFRVRCWCYSQATFEDGIEERVLGQRAVCSKCHGNHPGQDETRVITCFFALSFTWCSYSWEQVYGDSQRHWWYTLHLMLLVITSLWAHPWVQSIFSFMITQFLPIWEGWHGSLLLTHNWSIGWGDGGWPVGQVPRLEGRLPVEW